MLKANILSSKCRTSHDTSRQNCGIEPWGEDFVQVPWHKKIHLELGIRKSVGRCAPIDDILTVLVALIALQLLHFAQCSTREVMGRSREG